MKPKNYHYTVTLQFNLDKGYQTPKIIEAAELAAEIMSKELEASVTSRVYALVDYSTQTLAYVR